MGRGSKTGRKPKTGKRAPSGRLSRAKDCVMPIYDRGTERTQMMRAFYGEQGSDAIGRAYQAGLLGEGSEAKALLDTARRIANAYWQAFSTGSYQCALGDRSFGSVASLDHEKIKRREIWLSQCLDTVNRMGVRRQFDQLVIDVNPDCGPSWIDSLVWNAKQNLHRKSHEQIDAAPGDIRTLRAALDALEILVS